MVYADGAMPTVNFDPTTGKNMTSIPFDQGSLVTLYSTCRSVSMDLKNKQFIDERIARAAPLSSGITAQKLLLLFCFYCILI
ncbi:hypothetical protein [Desulfosarcina sp.]|uniref:hypothetical protein n=1 Tax=Desulfosarcina sp. TaxID=2027861 RepID=UPI0029BB905F|nr:hypothetical protein [Desulfosarcina sp.]MDX2451905.1 hypothetical protein [Desulfosarcina sp.]MDX2489695.1 hypothetical protein [Desulfosarcina sp.]